MAKYEIEIGKSAEKQLKKLPRTSQRRVARAILDLADDPFPRGCRKLSGFEDAFRIRVSRYRIIYSVLEDVLIVVVLKIGHRKDAYR